MLESLIQLQNEVKSRIYVATKATEQANAPSTREIFEDLTALTHEFPAWQFSFAAQTISMTTVPIELEEVQLGAFKIVLEVEKLRLSQPYRVIAEDANSAATCESTTHPHVQNESLCEGEGQQPIKKALAEGRLFDFFTIVNQVLRTYNAHSAYISLSDWSGLECRDCGSTVSDEDISSCSQCDGEICDECTCSCECCNDTYCDECLTSCEGCRDAFCKCCIETCERCNQPFCENCLTEDRCDDCDEKEEEVPAWGSNAESAKPAIHTLRVGETAVPA